MSSIIISSDYNDEVEALARDGSRKLTTVDALARVPVSDEEMISLLRTLQTSGPDKPRWTLGIISTLPGEGVSTIARGLARIVAKNPKAKVLICNVPTDSDVRRPSHGGYDGYGSNGDYHPGQLDFTWLPGGQVAVGSFGEPGYMHTIASDFAAVTSMVNRLSSSFELVILDLPPVSKSVIGPAMSKALDGVVMVVEAERTRSQSVRATQKAIQVHGGTVLGVVLNKRRSHLPKFLYRNR
jgi:succinoglycan biosynthesis transport protein ExoP